MNEIYLESNKDLVSEEKWKKLIESIRTTFNGLETNKDLAKKILKEKILDSIEKRTRNIDKFGILLSGGVDSSLIALICKQMNLKFNCYCVGFNNSKDLEAAKKVANVYKLSLKWKTLSLLELEESLKCTLNILKCPDFVSVSVGSVLYAAGEIAKKDKIKILFGGLGSEEIFAGYQRHEESLKKGFQAVHNECWNGLLNIWRRDLKRDYLIAKSLNLNLSTPYMDIDVIKYAMSIHPKLKIIHQEKKIILREIAEDIGLAKEIAFRKKKAAQYGSNFLNGIEKLAKKNKFKLKKDYIEYLYPNQVR